MINGGRLSLSVEQSVSGCQTGSSMVLEFKSMAWEMRVCSGFAPYTVTIREERTKGRFPTLKKTTMIISYLKIYNFYFLLFSKLC